MAWPNVVCHGSGYSRGSPGEPYQNTATKNPLMGPLQLPHRTAPSAGLKQLRFIPSQFRRLGVGDEGISMAIFSGDLCPRLRTATSWLGSPAAFPVHTRLCCPFLFL